MEVIKAITQAVKELGLPVRASYPVRQAAKILGIGKDTLYRAVHSGRVKAVPVGRVLYVPTTELARILAGEVELEPPTGAGRRA